MKRFFLLLAGIPLVVYPWVRTYGTGMGYSVRQTTDGGYIVSGNGSDEIGNLALILLKTDEVGDVQWRRHYIFAHGGYCVQETSDGGYIVVGITYIYDGAGDLLLMKTDEYGDTLWTRTYGYGWMDVGRWVEQTSDGGYIITGTSDRWGSGWKLWLLKTDEYGDTIWTQIYMICSRGYCVQQTNDNGYIIGTNFVLIKTDSIGDTLWTSPYGAPSVRQTTDGGYIMATSHYKDVWIIKTDSEGDTIWTRTYGGDGEEYSYCVQQTTDDGYIISGEPWTLLKTDEYGDTLWTRKYDIGRIVQQTTDGGYITCGYKLVEIDENHWDIVLSLTKTDSLGYAGVEEQPVPVTHQPDWRVVTPVGRTITLRYANRPQGFAASVFDVTGRKVDELRSSGLSGIVTWGEGHQLGVYFIKPISRSLATARKVVLVK